MKSFVIVMFIIQALASIGSAYKLRTGRSNDRVRDTVALITNLCITGWASYLLIWN
jgi:hypothetical protein